MRLGLFRVLGFFHVLANEVFPCFPHCLLFTGHLTFVQCPLGQADISRMEQQNWKRELDRQSKKEDEGDGNETEKPSSAGRKPRAKAKAKAKSKAKAKAKSTRTKTVAAAEEGEKKKTGRGKKKALRDQSEPDLVTPPPKESKVRGTGSKRKAPKNDLDEVEGKKVKKTFAQRYRPTTASGAALWDALSAAFATVAIQLNAPSKMEALVLKAGIQTMERAIKMLMNC